MQLALAPLERGAVEVGRAARCRGHGSGSIPVLGQAVADRAGWTAGEGRRDLRVGLDRAEQRLPVAGRRPRLTGEHEPRADLRSACAERECCGESAAVGDAAGRDHRHRHGVDHLRHERERPDERQLPDTSNVERCPPASAPWAITKSTPASATRTASSTVVTIAPTIAPQPANRDGSPSAKVSTGTPAARQSSTCSSTETSTTSSSRGPGGEAELRAERVERRLHRIEVAARAGLDELEVHAERASRGLHGRTVGSSTSSGAPRRRGRRTRRRSDTAATSAGRRRPAGHRRWAADADAEKARQRRRPHELVPDLGEPDHGDEVVLGHVPVVERARGSRPCPRPGGSPGCRARSRSARASRASSPRPCRSPPRRSSCAGRSAARRARRRSSPCGT